MSKPDFLKQPAANVSRNVAVPYVDSAAGYPDQAGFPPTSSYKSKELPYISVPGAAPIRDAKPFKIKGE